MALQLKKHPEVWYDLTDDEPKARILIGALTPKDRQDIEAASIRPNAEVKNYGTKDAEMVAKPDFTFADGQKVEVKKRIKGWENILDVDGSALPFNEKNVLMLFDNLDGFYQFVAERGAEVDALIEKQIAEKEKNLPTSRPGSQESDAQPAKPAKGHTKKDAGTQQQSEP